MEAELIQKGLWTNILKILVDSEKKVNDNVKKKYKTKLRKQFASKMAKAWEKMILRVDSGQLSHMRLKDPLEIYRNLQSVHYTHRFVTSLVLYRKLLIAKKTDNQSMQSWIRQIWS